MRHASVAVVGVVALIAGWFGSGLTAAVGFGLGDRPDEKMDKDKDGVYDTLERTLCGGNVSSKAIKIAQTGSCRTSKDWVPPNSKSEFFIPTQIISGNDIDTDGLADAMRLVGFQIFIEPADGTFLVAPGARLTVPLDQPPLGLDSTTSLPNQDVLRPETDLGPLGCLSVPAGVTLFADHDGDGLPGSAQTHKLTFQFSPGSFEVGCGLISMPQPIIIDIDDVNPELPVDGKVTVSVPVQAYHGGDSDNDLVPSFLALRWLDLTIDPDSRDPLQMSEHDSRHVLDQEPESSTTPIPFDAFDGDLDGVPDTAESWICQLQDTQSETDGRCVKADGSGEDGSGSNYVPPVGRPNPWLTPAVM